MYESLYRITAHDYQTGDAFGEVNYSDLEITAARNQLTAASFGGVLFGITAGELLEREFVIIKIDAYNPRWENQDGHWVDGYLDFTDPDDVVLVPPTFELTTVPKWTTVLTGAMIEFEEIEDGNDFPTFQASVISGAKRLEKIIADDSSGSNPGRTPEGLKLLQDDRGMHIFKMINDAKENWGNIWIRAEIGNQGQDCGTVSVPHGLGGFKSMAAVLDELAVSESLAGFEYKFKHTLEQTEDGLILADFQSGGVIGKDLSNDVFFEKGCGLNNITSTSMRRSTIGYLNRAIHPVAGLDPYAIVEQDSADIADKGIHEEVVDLDLSSTDLREQWANQNVQIRGDAQKIYTATPDTITTDSIKNHHQFLPFIDYDIGDLCRYRWQRNSRSRVDGSVRIWGKSVSVDESRRVNVNLELQA